MSTMQEVNRLCTKESIIERLDHTFPDLTNEMKAAWCQSTANSTHGVNGDLKPSPDYRDALLEAHAHYIALHEGDRDDK